MFLRATLSHAAEGDLVISVPDGWKEAEISFERHPDLHCVRPKFNTPFDFYGKNVIAGIDGGRDFILKVEKNHGPDAVLGILVERSQDGSKWKTLADQELSLSDAFADKVGVDHRVESTLTDKSFWAKFISRFETSVNINSDTNEDGSIADTHTPIDLTLTGQTLRQQAYADTGELATILAEVYEGTASTIPDNTYLEGEPSTTVLDEIEDHYSQFADLNSSLPAASFVAKYAGEYQVNARIYAYRKGSSLLAPLKGVGVDIADWYIDIDGTQHIMTHAEEFYNGVDGLDGTVSRFTIADTYTLAAGSEIRIYGYSNQFFDDNPVRWIASTSVNKSFFEVIADTEFEDSQIQADLIHDVGAKISDRITAVNGSFYSEVLGSPYTVTRMYAEEGIYWPYANALGLHARGYTLTEKPVFMSMKEYWDGINPIFNLGMGIKTIDGVEKIYIGKKAEFYPTDRVSVRLSGVYKITRKYDRDHQFNLIEQGYEKGKIEDVAGLDDWLQSSWATRFKKIGKKFTNYSKMIGCSLTWEQARRTSIEKSADYKYDNDVLIVNVKRVADAPYVPALDEEFDSVTNLINEATRYNKKLTPARNFLRWINYYSGCLQAYLSSTFHFAGGDGNTDMTSEMIDNGDVEAFGGDVMSEKQNIPVSEDFIFLPMPYEIEHYVTFSQLEAMLADPEAAIEISQTQADHKLFFMKNVKVQLSNGKITGELWPKEFMELQVVSKPGRIFSDEFGPEFG